MFRRILLVACTLLFLWAAPAAADSYGQVLSRGQQRTPTVDARPAVQRTTQSAGSLARTGSSDTVPMVQGAIVLMGGGALLVLAGRRRRTKQLRATD